MKIVSLFTGIGGFEQGIKESNLNSEVVFASEIDKHAQHSFVQNFPNVKLHGDITKIDENEIPNHEFLVAGFPCQAFSIAGKQQGFEDTRGTLFFDIVRILNVKKPRYILLENVKNLMSHDNGKTFKTIVKQLNNLGYTIDFTVINSNSAGLPQNRERTYIVGILDGRADEFFYDNWNKKVNRLKGELNYKGFNFFNTLLFNNVQLYLKDIIDNDADAKYLITNDLIKEFLKDIDYYKNVKLENKIVKLFDLPKEIWNDLERQRRVYSIYGISPTILARADTTKILLKNEDGYFIRKLTPTETFRAQGFNNDFIKKIQESGTSMTQQYKQSGNAVSPPVITGIVNHLMKFMNEESFDKTENMNLNIENSKKNFKFIDLFSGLGGFRIALESLGGECVFSSDNDLNVSEVYKKNFGDDSFCDIKKVSSSDIPDHDILCAGFPCQPFSIAGKRLGFEDTRGTLFFDVARILGDKNPKAFILENVRGIANHDGGKTLEVILATLDELGYDTKHEILNAKDFNIPQSRVRWYCVGIRRDLNIGINEYNFPEKEELTVDLSNVIENIDSSEYAITETCQANIDYHVSEKLIDVDEHTLAYEIRPSRCSFVTNGISNCLTAKMGTGGNNVPVVIQQNRKLTELECLRLMGFPEDYIIGKGYQAYKQIGNSVVVPVIKRIAEGLVDLLNIK